MGSGGSMSFIGTVGVVAQQGNQTLSGPTVNISTSSSGNYADDMLIYSQVVDLNDDPLIAYTGGEASSEPGAPNITVEFDFLDFASAQNNLGAGSSLIHIGGYVRAVPSLGGIQGYTYTMSNIDLSNMDQTGNYFTSAAAAGTPIEGPDGTDVTEDGDGFNTQLRMIFPSGKGGYATPEAGDYLTFDINCTVADESPFTTVDTLTVQLEWN